MDRPAPPDPMESVVQSLIAETNWQLSAQAMDDLGGLNNLANLTLDLTQRTHPHFKVCKWKWKSALKRDQFETACSATPQTELSVRDAQVWRAWLQKAQREWYQPQKDAPNTIEAPRSDRPVPPPIVHAPPTAGPPGVRKKATLDQWLTPAGPSGAGATFGLKRGLNPVEDQNRGSSEPKKRNFGLGAFGFDPPANAPPTPFASYDASGAMGRKPKFGLCPAMEADASRASSLHRTATPRLPERVENADTPRPNPFRTASEQLVVNYQRQGRLPQSSTQTGPSSATLMKKSLGVAKPSGYGSFRSPVVSGHETNPTSTPLVSTSNVEKPSSSTEIEVTDERYKNVDPKMVELIENEIMDTGSAIVWEDIAGLDFVKTTVKEIVVFPMLRPDIFKGLRAPPKGLLLFGPPGTGKTLIGKCIASQSNSTFFSISASSLTSKWVGEGEKMVRALFAVASVRQPSVVFIDEIDSLLTQRSDTEHESSRRIKTEFLVQLDGATTQGDERILVVGATNRPQELDEAARRRLVKRLYVPLPEAEARFQIIQRLMVKERHELSREDMMEIVQETDGYSGADMTNLCKDAAMGPIRSLDYSKIESIDTLDVRPIRVIDFRDALRQVKASVSDRDLALYLDWNNKFGSGK
ncbi:hypothetical protein TCAL_10276 [Tigriopus californicus]|uniref:Fidgetin-like protein 1 n=1 Tax=Tigriopus californicus TaxID=6832 RepID=A0A553N864_TIGCA|nr:fidgetin-like protein 1 [Tigriopus californicus]TRY61589.1 hypothetical protein TCAL_10276 [Tigriopus californicus]